MNSSAPLPPEVARRLVIAEAVPSGSEPVPLSDCLGRVTASAIRAAEAIPPFDNSAMDGYALRSADTEGAPRPLAIVGESRAGHPAERGPSEGEAVRISTGAVVPPGADAVVPLEQASEEGGRVAPSAGPVAPGAHVRRAGEDIAAGEVAIAAGRVIGPVEQGVLASLGTESVECARRPTVAVFTSGDELLAPGGTAAPGQIYDSNRFTVTAMAREAGAEARHAGLLPDQPEAIGAAIERGLDADLVVICGGVSVGPHDHVKSALAELGVEQVFWRVALRPGGPVWFGVLRRGAGQRPTLVFGLPGNPVSSMVTFHLFARAAILAATGRDPDSDRAGAVLAEGYRKAAGRAHYLRARLEPGEAGWRAALTTERQGSHVLSSMRGADCLAVIPAERTEVEAGELIEVRLL